MLSFADPKGLSILAHGSFGLNTKHVEKTPQNKRARKTDVFWTLLEAPTRFELVMKVLQTSALPLGYGA